MPTLYEITNSVRLCGDRIQDLLLAEMDDAERDKAIEEALADLDAAEFNIDTKMENCFKFRRSLKADAESLQREIVALQGKKRAIEAQDERFADYMIQCLRTVDGSRIKTPLMSLWVSHSESLEITDPQELPPPSRNRDLYNFKDPELRKDVVKKMLKAGEKIGGVKLITRENLVMR